MHSRRRQTQPFCCSKPHDCQSHTLALAPTTPPACHSAAAAKRHMVGFQVDTQTALVESGEKPTVTPAMLAVSGAWK